VLRCTILSANVATKADGGGRRGKRCRQSKGLFGWVVAVKKAVVGYELWKKLLWAVSC
jgi:hypothetical protein